MADTLLTSLFMTYTLESFNQKAWVVFNMMLETNYKTSREDILIIEYQ